MKSWVKERTLCLTKHGSEDGIDEETLELLATDFGDVAADEALPGEQLDHLDTVHHLVTLLHPLVCLGLQA